MHANSELGQCFLQNKAILNQIASIVNINNKHVVEIGPGTGNLTSYIHLKNPASLTLYEIDIRFIELLRQNYANVIHANCLNVNIETEIIISNLPYNISTPFCKKLILIDQWNECVLLLQYEFAQKIYDIYNILGFVFAVTCDIKIIRKVSRENFHPKPAVMSAIVHIVRKQHNYNVQKLWNFADKMFSRKRKKIGFGKYSELRITQLTLRQIMEIYEEYN